MRKFLLLLLPIMINTLDKTYTIHCFHEWSTADYRLNNRITIDSKPVYCFCGSPPCFVFISFGRLECYCLNHARLCLSATNKEDFYGQKV